MRSNEVMDQMSPRGKALARVGAGGCFGCLRLNCEASLQLGRLSWNALACVYCVRGSGGGGCSPGKIFKPKPPKMA